MRTIHSILNCPREMKIPCMYKNIHINVCGSLIFNSPKLKPKQ
jgi:hypothetical protein